MKTRQLAACILLATLLAGAHAKPTSVRRTDNKLVEKLRKRIPKLLEQAGVPGLSAALLRDGKPAWAEGFGVKSLASRQPVSEDTVFEAASLSKPVFAAAVLQLALRGEFNLDQPLLEILPYPRLDHDPRARDITARHILSHASGLPNWGGTPLKMRFSPGVAWGYSGEGYVFLAKALEKKTGLTLEELVQREVLKPLEMGQSSFVWQEQYEDRIAAGHDSLGQVQDLRKSSESNAAASLKTTAPEYARFVSALINGTGLHPDTLKNMNRQTSQVRGWSDLMKLERDLFWGLGWGIQESEDGGTALWHWGDNGIYRCYVLFDPAAGDGLVYFTNSENGLAIAKPLAAEVFPGQQAALEWLDYENYDDPRRQVRIAARKAFTQREPEPAWKTFNQIKQAHADVVDEKFLRSLGDFLIDRQKYEAAVRVLKEATADFPESAAAADLLGRALLAADRIEEAAAEFQRLARLDENSKTASQRLQWVESLSQARQNPIVLEAPQLQRLSGHYGPREVRFRDGKLFYERQGTGREYELFPLDALNFGLRGLNTFRLRFEEDDEGKPAKLIGLYADGRIDGHARQP